MRRVISDLLISAGRRPGNNLSSLRNRTTNGNKSQRRHNSNKPIEKNDLTPTKESSPPSETTTSPSTVPPPPTGSVTSSAGAATSPLPAARSSSSRRGIGELIKSGPIGRFGNWYTNAQHKRPYVTQLASSFIIYLAGDLSAQLLFPSEVKTAENKDGKEGEESVATVGYDPLRTLRHLTVGLVSSIPSYKWFMFLHHNFNYTSKFLSITTKVAVQQAVFTPVFNTYFFSMQSLLAGASIFETWERLKLAVPNSIKNSVKLWPAVTAFSFMYIPPHFRSVFGGTIAVGWQTYLSWLNQKAAREVAAAEAATNALKSTTLQSADGNVAAIFNLAKQNAMQPNDLDDDSSDYGSDFTLDEQELLSELLARVVAPEHQTSTVTTTTAEETTTATTSESQQQLLAELLLDDLQPLSDPLIVSDIEDYELPHSVRVPRVLGREAWSPATKRVWQRQQNQTGGTITRRLWPSQLTAAVNVRSQIGEREGSPEGRTRDRERQRDREKEWTDAEGRTEAKTEPQTESTPANVVNNEDGTTAPSVEQKSPIERFRKPPNKAFSVSDLISPAWCELQYWYTLTKHGRKRRTPAMMQGTAVHKVLEDEVHTTVPVDITTKEDGWALRIWNVIQGLRTLRTYGLTRELEVWGLVEGEIVTGIIDQLSYICPDPKLEASAARHYADAEAARAALPEYQMSISDYFMASGAGKPLDEMWKQPEEPAPTDDDYGTDLDQSYLDVPRIYITDIKTRASRSVPTVKSTGFRPTHLQLQLYYHILNRSVTSDDVTMEAIAERYDLDPQRTFSDAFIAEVGGLNEEFFDAASSPISSSDPDFVPVGSSQDSVSILLSHNNLHSLWDLMKKHLRYTFLPTSQNQNIAPSIPAAVQPDSLALYPTVLSPVLTAKYLSSTKMSEDGVPDELGSRSFLFDPSDLTSYTSDQIKWWRGDRAPRGVEVFDAWKCRICDFREECDWRISKEYEFATRRRRLSKTAIEMLGPV